MRWRAAAPTGTRLAALALLVAGCMPFGHDGRVVFVVNQMNGPFLVRLNQGGSDRIVAVGPDMSGEAWNVDRSTRVTVELLATDCRVLGTAVSPGPDSQKLIIDSGGLTGPMSVADGELTNVPNLDKVGTCVRDTP